MEERSYGAWNEGMCESKEGINIKEGGGWKVECGASDYIMSSL